MLTFTVHGAPVGYKRTTQGMKFSPEYKRYQLYKDDVVAAFLAQCPGDWELPRPLTTVKGETTTVDIVIYFKNLAHPDPSNVHKAIEDALFACDKFCWGSFKFYYDKLNPRVEVTIA